MVDRPKKDVHRTSKRSGDRSGLNAQGRVQAKQNAIKLPGENGAFSCHEDVEEYSVEEIEHKREDQFSPDLVLLVSEHPDHGKE
ncbi:MAG: hypothetical protein ACP5E2_11100 [Terracidiphilus sp.]